SIASSSALTMIWRSMPFSLLTCSMTRVRSGCMETSRASCGRVRLPGRAGEVVLDVGLLDGGERHGDHPRVRILDAHPVGRDRAPDTVELSRRADRLPAAHADPLPERALEVRLAQERSVESRRRALEVIPAGDRIVGVEYVPELARDVRQLVEGDAPLG